MLRASSMQSSPLFLQERPPWPPSFNFVFSGLLLVMEIETTLSSAVLFPGVSCSEREFSKKPWRRVTPREEPKNIQFVAFSFLSTFAFVVRSSALPLEIRHLVFAKAQVFGLSFLPP
ncbi:hypothetical protein I7I50_08310 [Histoplasma capsulatum G186AR]|uniref:Uncharacterized protein n=1 Tax=Ajellomyces capsulatus TaxID=5037 RepID=A0A8H8CZ64_AJECA|nr:hypothetical protein I7I52_05826 [Histoplasma capsulatum]QSS73516.1 hypothetical protein I7I50_08310 [Histoplasma capsulatum G186AR]